MQKISVYHPEETSGWFDRSAEWFNAGLAKRHPGGRK
jgi:hypothetical protein